MRKPPLLDRAGRPLRSFDIDNWYDGECGTPALHTDPPLPQLTGVLRPDGSPVLRHPVVMRLGFHREADKFHTPSADEDGATVGWAYEV